MDKNKIIEALAEAEKVAKNSPDPYRKVGAVILDSDGYIISNGWNDCPEKFKEDESFWADKEKRKPYMIHAEIMALIKTVTFKDDILVVTLKPCHNCILAIASAGIKEVWYKEEKSNMELTDKIAEAYDIKLYKI